MADLKEDLLSIGETARLMDVSENTLRDWDIEDKFEATRTSGGHRRYSLSQIREYLDKNPPKNKMRMLSGNEYSELEKNIEIWEEKGYLDDVDEPEKHTLATLLNNYLIYQNDKEDSLFSTDQGLWLTKEAWMRCRFKKIVSVQPMSGPVSLVFYNSYESPVKETLNILSEGVAAKTTSFDFKFFDKGKFGDLKETYADAIADSIDSLIIDNLIKMNLRISDVDALVDASKIISDKFGYDYIIATQEKLNQINKSAIEGVDVYPIPFILDDKTFKPVALVGNYPKSCFEIPIYCPYIVFWEGVGTFNYTRSVIHRAGWFKCVSQAQLDCQ